MISFSDEDTPKHPPLTEKMARIKEVKNNTANGPAPIGGWKSPTFPSPFTSRQKYSVQEQRQRESYAGACASANDHARNVLPNKENALSGRKAHMMDAFEEEMEANEVVALKPEVRKGPEPLETAPVKHLLD